jgi:hypothetical protein
LRTATSPAWTGPGPVEQLAQNAGGPAACPEQERRATDSMLRWTGRTPQLACVKHPRHALPPSSTDCVPRHRGRMTQPMPFLRWQYPGRCLATSVPTPVNRPPVAPLFGGSPESESLSPPVHDQPMRNVRIDRSSPIMPGSPYKTHEQDGTCASAIWHPGGHPTTSRRSRTVIIM